MGYDLEVKVGDLTLYEFENQDIDTAKDNVERAIRNFDDGVDKYDVDRLEIVIEKA